MRSAAAVQTLSSIADEFFPTEKLTVLEVPFFEDALRRGKAFQAAVAGAKPGTCLALQPGTYPPLIVRRSVYVRADIPGTVEIIAEKGQPALVSAAPCVRLQGVSLIPALGDDTAAVVHSGCLILEESEIEGTVATLNSAAKLYLTKCRIQAKGAGLQAAAGSAVFVDSSAFVSCSPGAVALENSRLEISHSRFLGCGRGAAHPADAAVRAVKASLVCSGCRLVSNEKGVVLDHCKEASLTACLFDSNAQGSVIVHGDNPPKLHGLQFRGPRAGGTEHVILNGADAEMPFCTFSDDSLLSGIVPESVALSSSANPLERALMQLKKIAVSREIKGGLEAIFRNAESALQRVERGLPVPSQLFHCVFEGETHLGQHRVGALLANFLNEVGFLSTNKLSEVFMEDLLLHKKSIEEVASESRGGALLIQVTRFENKRDAHSFYAKAREILESLIAASGNSSLLILCGERSLIRPILKQSALAEALGKQAVRFAPYVPGELLQVFTMLCEDHEIRVTPRAIEKLLLTFYMLDDRRDKRFAKSDGVRSLFETSEKQHRQRCAIRSDYTLPLDEEDLKLPLKQNADFVAASQPALITLCPKCGAEIPWLPGTSEAVSHCPDCGHAWEPGWGIWKESTFFRRLTQKEEGNGNLDAIRPASRRFKREILS